MSADGPVAIVPAPYHRNLDRLSRALLAAHARLRTEGDAETASVRFGASAAALSAGERWTLRCDAAYDLDIEMFPAERYSELLYEAGRIEIEPGLSVEVASLDALGEFDLLRGSQQADFADVLEEQLQGIRGHVRF